ncbi:MAG: SCP2 sterol-binding domain-containing protein, partial [Actinomycetota bacterium]
ERGDALLVSAGLLPLLPYYVDPESSAEVQSAYEVNLRGLRFALLFDRGTLTVAPPGAARPDCRIAADPVAFMLVSYGRISPVKPALTGKLLAYGRKPWLGLRLTSLLKNP